MVSSTDLARGVVALYMRKKRFFGVMLLSTIVKIASGGSVSDDRIPILKGIIELTPRTGRDYSAEAPLVRIQVM